jgi:transposase
MQIQLSEAEREELRRAAAGEPRVRVWRRYQAILWLGQGQSTKTVAASLGCQRSSVYNWIAAWQERGRTGLAEALHGHRPRCLDGSAEQTVEPLLASDPQREGEQSTGWTVALLRTHLAQAGYTLSARTLRRTLHRLGWRWKRPRYQLGRPDPAYAAKKGRWWSR